MSGDEHGDEAPEEPSWAEQALDVAGDVADFAGDMAAGFVEGAWESVKFVGGLAYNFVADPAVFFEDLATVAQGVGYAVTHPVEFVSKTWDTFTENPARSIGSILGGLVVGAGVAKAGKVLHKTGDFAKVPRQVHIDDAQFGKKVGKHASDYGLNPANPADREWVKNHIEDVVSRPNEVRQGAWHPSSGGGDYYFYRQGDDVVITENDGQFRNYTQRWCQ